MSDKDNKKPTCDVEVAVGRQISNKGRKNKRKGGEHRGLGDTRGPCARQVIELTGVLWLL